MDLDKNTLTVLACDISVRPAANAGIDDLLNHVLSVRMTSNKLTVEFDIAGTAALLSFVEAERMCCTTLTWNIVESAASVQLNVEGTPDQLGVINLWFQK